MFKKIMLLSAVFLSFSSDAFFVTNRTPYTAYIEFWLGGAKSKSDFIKLPAGCMTHVECVCDENPYATQIVLVEEGLEKRRIQFDTLSKTTFIILKMDNKEVMHMMVPATKSMVEVVARSWKQLQSTPVVPFTYTAQKVNGADLFFKENFFTPAWMSK